MDATARTGVIAFLLASGLAVVVMGGIVLSAWDRPASVAVPREQGEKQDTVRPVEKMSSAKSADPWPECAVIRQWLKENTGDPASIEIIKWEFRGVFDKDVDTVAKGTATIEVRFRGRNQFGAMTAQLATFVVLPNGQVSGRPIIH